MNILSLVVVCCGLFCASTSSSQNNTLPTDGEGVCKVYVRVSKLATTTYIASTTDEVCCNSVFWTCQKYCKVSRYSTKTKQFTLMTHKAVNQCCNGWKISSLSNNTCLPVCEKKCLNGNCMAPNHCECEHGYTGKQCENGGNSSVHKKEEQSLDHDSQVKSKKSRRPLWPWMFLPIALLMVVLVLVIFKRRTTDKQYLTTIISPGQAATIQYHTFQNEAGEMAVF